MPSNSEVGKPSRDAERYEVSVFVNCPFDPVYQPLFEALIFAIRDCRFRPRCALEVSDSGDIRIKKIERIISECRLGIHDISRIELGHTNGLPRFNMPLELGLFLGARAYGNRVQKRKQCLILDSERFRYQAFCSDISGQDIEAHSSESSILVTKTRNWLRGIQSADASARHDRRGEMLVIPGGQQIFKRYRQFQTELPGACRELGLDDSPLPFVEYLYLVDEWLLENDWRPNP
jgi:hypothetical protein